MGSAFRGRASEREGAFFASPLLRSCFRAAGLSSTRHVQSNAVCVPVRIPRSPVSGELVDTAAHAPVPWFRLSLKLLLVAMLVVGAYFAGSVFAQRRNGKAIHEAQDAAETARKLEEATQKELDSLRGPAIPPPIITDENGVPLP